MNLENKPSNERKLIYFIENSNYNNLQYHDQGKELLTNPEILVIPLNETDVFLDNYSIIEDPYPYDGMVATLSPYDNTKYSEITNANENFCLEKFMNIITLCHLIGARNVYIDQTDKNIDSKESNNDGGGNYKVIEAKINHKSTYLNEKIDKMLLKTSFSGGECDYDGAMKFLRKKRLASDSILSNLVEMRNASNNKINSFTHEVSLSNNSDRTNSILASISLPMGGGKFKHSSKKISEKKYYLEITIKF